MIQEPQRDQHPTRRSMLAGVGLAGLAGTLAACGTKSTSGASDSAASPAAAASSAAAAGSGSGQSSAALATTSEIPVGGGKVFGGPKVVVTQPAAGDFKGFSAICTHMGCTVDQVANGTIDCPCHGSQFSVKDGSVVAGPAPSPLPAAAIKVTGNNITLG